MSYGTAVAQEPGQRWVKLSDPTPFNPDLPRNEQLMRELVLNTYSKPLYEFCEQYLTINFSFIDHGPEEESQFEVDLRETNYDRKRFFLNINTPTWPHLFVAKSYITNHAELYVIDAINELLLNTEYSDKRTSIFEIMTYVRMNICVLNEIMSGPSYLPNGYKDVAIANGLPVYSSLRDIAEKILVTFPNVALGGRRRSSKPSKKRSIRRRRSSKARKARKARATRRR